MKRPVAYVTTFRHSYGLTIIEHDSRHNELRKRVVPRVVSRKILGAFKQHGKPVYQH